LAGAQLPQLNTPGDELERQNRTKNRAGVGTSPHGRTRGKVSGVSNESAYLRIFRSIIVVGLGTALVLCLVPDAYAQSAENVAIVINDNSPASQRIGEYYARKHALPAANVFRLRTSAEETIDRVAYLKTIEQPIAALIEQQGLQDRILYLVLTKGVPLRVAGTGGHEGSIASVDSELTLLYRRMAGQEVPIPGRVDNPYFLNAREIREAHMFSHRDQDIYLVSRLDAFTVDEAIGLVDKGAAPVTEGRIVLDQRDTLGDRTGENWLALAASRLMRQGNGDRVVLEATVKPARDIKPVIGYYSWGSNDPNNRVRDVRMGFVPGSIAATFVSSDGRTFQQPPTKWMPTNDWDAKTSWFGGSPQSLAGDLIHAGATGVAGHVAEPFLESTVRPEILFPAYLTGFNLIEAFYLAMPHLSWQTVVIGDPLCAPFRRKSLSRSDIDPGADAETALPAFFSKRSLENLTKAAPTLPRRAITLRLRGSTLLARGDRSGGREALEQATQLAPGLVGSQMQLALLYEQIGQYDAAMERYRRILEVQPSQTVALNNLAYSLATRRHMPAEALPLAKRAVAAAPDEPALLDTLGWIQHLAGDDASASKTMAQAVRGGPKVAEIHLHAAIVFAASAMAADARKELGEAIALDPSLKGRVDVRELTLRIDHLAH
jgi:uncharacterized protein (TIGR03790 family)